MIAKNTESIETLKGLLLRKKNKMVKQNASIQHSLLIDLAMKCLSRTEGTAGECDVSESVMECSDRNVKRKYSTIPMENCILNS